MVNCRNLFLIFSCSASIQAMNRTISNDSMLELQRLLKFNRASNCSMRHRISYNEWLRRQEKSEREIKNAEVPLLLSVLGFSALPNRTSEIDKRVQEIVSSPLFCDQIYKDQQAQETIRALARDAIIAGEILKGAITNRPRIVPIFDKNSLLLSPLSSLTGVLVSYVTNNVPDINTDDITRVQELVSQLLRQAERAEPAAKEIRTKIAQDLTNYIKQTVPLLYEGEFNKGANRIPTEEEYKYAMQLLSQNKRLNIPKKVNAAIEAWRIQASEFLKSTDYQPERYKDPEIAHLVKSMVEDINSAAAIIKAYLQKKATTAIVKKPSFVDPGVHNRIKEIIKAISDPEIAAAEERDLSSILNEQKAKIEQLPPEYQQALKQYFNINERIQKISPAAPSVPAAEIKPTEPTKEPEPTPALAPVSIAQPSVQPAEQKPAEPVPSPTPSPAPEQTPAPTEEIKPVGLEKTPEKAAAAATTATTATPAEQPGAPIPSGSPTTGGGAPTTATAGESTPSLKEALEKQGEIREIAVSTAAKAAATSPATPASATTPSKPSSSTPSSSVSSSTPPISSAGQMPSIIPSETPVVTPTSPTIETSQPTGSTGSTTSPAVEAPSIQSPSASQSTGSVPSGPTQSQGSVPSVQSVQQSAKVLQDSLEELRNQLRQIDTRTS